jgi:hypothetical protein
MVLFGPGESVLWSTRNAGPRTAWLDGPSPPWAPRPSHFRGRPSIATVSGDAAGTVTSGTPQPVLPGLGRVGTEQCCARDGRLICLLLECLK